MTMTPPAIPKVPELKPLHALILFVFSVFAMEFAWRLGVDAGHFRAFPEFQMLFVRMGAVALGIAMLSVSPELRAAMKGYFSKPAVFPLPFDVVLAVAVAYTYCIGVHRVVVVMPLVMTDVKYFHAFWNLNLSTGYQNLVHHLAMIAAMVVFTPIVEELFFRGVLLNAWRAKHSMMVSILLSSAVFGLAHGRMAIMAFGLGIVLALVFLRYRSLWPAIVVHGVYNLLQLVPPFAQLGRPKPLVQSVFWEAWTFEIALSIAFIPLAFVFWHRFKPT